MPLNLNLFEILIHAITIITLVVIFRVLLYKPIKKFMDERHKMYEDMDKEKRANLENAKKLEQEKNELLKTTKQNIIKMSEEALNSCKNQEANIINNANIKANEIIEAAYNEVNSLKNENLTNMKDQLKEVSEMLAKTILNREINNSDIDSEIEDIIKEYNK